MATYNLFPGGIADFTTIRPGFAVPGSAGLNPLKPAGHHSRGAAFIQTSLDFSMPTNRFVNALRTVSPALAIGDILNVLVIPQRSLWLGTCIAIDSPIAGLAFDIKVTDDPATGPVLDYVNSQNGITTNLNDYDGVATDNAPGVDGVGTSVTVAAAYSAATVGFTQYATAVANQPMLEQAFLQLVLTAVPSSPTLANTFKGKIDIGAQVWMAMFASID